MIWGFFKISSKYHFLIFKASKAGTINILRTPRSTCNKPRPQCRWILFRLPSWSPDWIQNDIIKNQATNWSTVHQNFSVVHFCVVWTDFAVLRRQEIDCYVPIGLRLLFNAKRVAKKKNPSKKTLRRNSIEWFFHRVCILATGIGMTPSAWLPV